ncbi:hypothetical protein QZH41_008702 [Actinostola sp. cb2023]|nr:hypothetical protein QZH41_008702 [Actinostola sp. cb2023]
MESEAAPTSPKRAKVALEEDEHESNTEGEGENSRDNESSTTSVEPTSTEKPTTTDDVVVISSDDDSDKDGNKVKSEEQSPADGTTKTDDDDKISTSDQTSDQTTLEEQKEDVKDCSDTKNEESSELTLGPSPKSTIDSDENNTPKSSDSDECISQEDLLAHLGLESVRAISNPKPKKEERLSNGVLTERRPLIPHKPKDSIVDLLRAPKLKNHEEKGKKNGEAPLR